LVASCRGPEWESPLRGNARQCLLNEFLKEHREAEEQEHKLAAQDSGLQRNATIRPANEKLRFYPVIAVPAVNSF